MPPEFTQINSTTTLYSASDKKTKKHEHHRLKRLSLSEDRIPKSINQRLVFNTSMAVCRR